MSTGLQEHLAALIAEALLDEKMADTHGYRDLAVFIAERLASAFTPMTELDEINRTWRTEPFYRFARPESVEGAT